ncbi:MAG: lysylphosphatidylglycerol synthase transmembrane domain-containing protein [Candidatus Daviesbacteria bacterium]|nr:lysylphosphatidylglycerol synthase transmembrane domain-containing protein [Candidatus Daviesbacteria bacterium]
MISRTFLLKILFNTFIGVIAVFVWLKFVNLSDIKTILVGVKPQYLILILFTIWLAISFRAFRLKFFLSPLHKIRLREILWLNGVSIMLNFLIPIRGGDITRGIYLSRTYHIPVQRSLTWVFLDHFIDFLVLLLLTPPLLLLVPNNLGGNVGMIAIGISGVMLIVAYLMIFQASFAKILLEFATNFLIFDIFKKHFRKFYIHMLDSFMILKRSSHELIFLVFITIMAYLADGLTLYFTFLSVGIHISYIESFLAQFLSALTYLVPAAPGYVGSAEASGLIVFSAVLGINQNLASAASLVFHGSLAIFAIVYGIFCLQALDLNPFVLLKRVSKEAD